RRNMNFRLNEHGVRATCSGLALRSPGSYFDNRRNMEICQVAEASLAGFLVLPRLPQINFSLLRTLKSSSCVLRWGCLLGPALSSMISRRECFLPQTSPKFLASHFQLGLNFDNPFAPFWNVIVGINVSLRVLENLRRRSPSCSIPCRCR